LLTFELLPLGIPPRQMAVQPQAIRRYQERQMRGGHAVLLPGNQLAKSIGVEERKNFFLLVNLEMVWVIHWP